MENNGKNSELISIILNKNNHNINESFLNFLEINENFKADPFIFSIFLENNKNINNEYKYKDLELTIKYLIDKNKLTDADFCFESFIKFATNKNTNHNFINIFEYFVNNYNIILSKNIIKTIITDIDTNTFKNNFIFDCISYQINNDIFDSSDVNDIIIYHLSSNYYYYSNDYTIDSNITIKLFDLIKEYYPLQFSPSLFTILLLSNQFCTLEYVLKKFSNDVNINDFYWNNFINYIFDIQKLEVNESESLNNVLKYFIKNKYTMNKEQINNYFSKDFCYDNFIIKTVISQINSNELCNDYIDKIIKIYPVCRYNYEDFLNLFQKFEFREEQFMYFLNKSLYHFAEFIIKNNNNLNITNENKEKCFNIIIQNDIQYFDYIKYSYWRGTNIYEKIMDLFMNLFYDINISKTNVMYIINNYELSIISNLYKNNNFTTCIKENLKEIISIYIANSNKTDFIKSLWENKIIEINDLTNEMINNILTNGTDANILYLIENKYINKNNICNDNIIHILNKRNNIIKSIFENNIIKKDDLTDEIKNLIINKNFNTVLYFINNDYFEKNNLSKEHIDIIIYKADNDILQSVFEKKIIEKHDLTEEIINNIINQELENSIQYLIENQIFDENNLNKNNLINIIKKYDDDTLELILKKNIFSKIKFDKSDLDIIIENLEENMILQFLELPCFTDLDLNGDFLDTACKTLSIKIIKLILENKVVPTQKQYNLLFNNDNAKVHKDKIVKLVNLFIHYGYEIKDEDIVFATKNKIELEPSQYTQKYIPSDEFYKNCSIIFIPSYNNVNKQKAYENIINNLLENTIFIYDLAYIKNIVKVKFKNKKIKLTENARNNLKKFNDGTCRHKRIRNEILDLCD
jgi:hypothetical protein